MRTIITNAKIITPFQTIDKGSVVIEHGMIVEVTGKSLDKRSGNDLIIDSKGLIVSPGFIDIHTHGAGNSDFMDGSIEAICNVCRTHMKFGTTSIVPTTLSSDYEELIENLTLISEASKIKDNMPEILGIHLEGPYFSINQKGAQDPKYIKFPDPEEYTEIYNQCPMIIRWSIAPELPGSMAMGRWMRENKIIPSIGHSDANYSEVLEAYENGFRTVTHLFNGMSRLTRKNADFYLGVAESALLIDDLFVEIIGDGKHLPPRLIELIYKVKGPDRICLVTDSGRAAGTSLKESVLGSLKSGQRIIIEDGVAYMPDRKSFGSSISTADRLIRTMINQVHIPLHQAIKMLTYTPAKAIQIDDRKGSLTPGKDADIILFDEDINIQLVMVKGAIWINQLEI